MLVRVRARGYCSCRPAPRPPSPMQPAVLPRLPAAACLLGVTACSFAAQLLLSRGFQLETATKASAANFTQVLCEWECRRWGWRLGSQAVWLCTCWYASRWRAVASNRLMTAQSRNPPSPAGGHAIGVALFHEHTSALGLLGAALVVAGVAAVSADKHHHQPPKPSTAGIALGSKPAHAAGAELTPQPNGLPEGREGRAAWQIAGDCVDEEAAAAGERGPLLAPQR